MKQLVVLRALDDQRTKLRNDFGDQLIVPPGSSICYDSSNLTLSGAFDGETFNVNGLTYEYGIGGNRTVITLPLNYENQVDFLNAVVHNGNLYNTSDRNIDWTYFLTGNKVTLQIGEYSQTDADYDTRGKTQGTIDTLNATEFLSDGDQPTRYLSDTYLSRGHFRLTTQYVASDSTMTLGVLSSDGDINDIQTATGLSLDPVTGNYHFLIFNNRFADLGIPVEDDDALFLDYSQGTIAIQIVDTLGAIKYDDVFNLRDFLSKQQLLEQRFQYFAENLGDGTTATTGGFALSTVTEVRNDNIDPQSNVIFSMQKQLSIYLGYKLTNYNKGSAANVLTEFQADFPVQGDKNSRGVFVTLTSSSGILRNFDGGTGTLKNIIRWIPETANISGTGNIIDTDPKQNAYSLGNPAAARIDNIQLHFYTNFGDPPLAIRKGSSLSLIIISPDQPLETDPDNSKPKPTVPLQPQTPGSKVQWLN